MKSPCAHASATTGPQLPGCCRLLPRLVDLTFRWGSSSHVEGCLLVLGKQVNGKFSIHCLKFQDRFIFMRRAALLFLVLLLMAALEAQAQFHSETASIEYMDPGGTNASTEVSFTPTFYGTATITYNVQVGIDTPSGGNGT